MSWDRWHFRGVRQYLPIQYVRVEGKIENLDLAKFKEALWPAVNGGYFFQDLGEIEGAIRSFAWIDSVRLTRVWPDTLEIAISEQKAVARWGDRALLNIRGERFAPEGIEAFASLPVIYGPPGMEAYLLDILKTLDEQIGKYGVKVASLDLSKRRAWIVRLTNGLELHFGRQDPVKTMDRFLGLVPKLGEEGFNRLKKVDLRYSNGFALVWKPQSANGGEIQGETGGAPQF